MTREDAIRAVTDAAKAGGCTVQPILVNHKGIRQRPRRPYRHRKALQINGQRCVIHGIANRHQTNPNGDAVYARVKLYRGPVKATDVVIFYVTFDGKNAILVLPGDVVASVFDDSRKHHTLYIPLDGSGGVLNFWNYRATANNWPQLVAPSAAK
jgi:hypothetical protein